jgi:hypothetical protein
MWKLKRIINKWKLTIRILQKNKSKMTQLMICFIELQSLQETFLILKILGKHAKC